MRRNRAAKIVCTLGPASTTDEKISALFEAGADVFRLNFSHGTHQEHAERYASIRRIERDFVRPIGIMMDLQGPKIRVDTFEGGAVDLSAGSVFTFDCHREQAGTVDRVSISNPEIYTGLEPGMKLLLDDGKIRLRVEEANQEKVRTTVQVGGVLSDHKGLNLPGAILPMSALTDKDRTDLRFGLDLGGIGSLCPSFSGRRILLEARRLIAGRAGILCKMEKPKAIEHLEQIIQLTDAIMVARGDLGVEAPPEDVPGLQKNYSGRADGGQTSDCRHTDAGVDDSGTDAYQGGSIGRRDRRFRRRGRCDAIGGDRGGKLSHRSCIDHGPDYSKGGTGSQLQSFDEYGPAPAGRFRC